jgi:hypothetical protein
MTKTHSPATTVRDLAKQNVKDSVTEAASKDHERNYEKLHVRRDGTVSWFESINKSDDLIDRQASDFRAVPSVITVGTGSVICNCDHCQDEGYETIADAIYDAVSNSDLSDIEERMLRELDAIEMGYFDDEEAA